MTKSEIVEVIERLKDSTQDEREEFLDAIKAEFCIHCMDHTGDEACYCENDE